MIPWVSGHGIGDQKYLKTDNEDDSAPQMMQHPELLKLLYLTKFTTW